MKTENIENCLLHCANNKQIREEITKQAVAELEELKRLAEVGERLYGPGECAKKQTCSRNSPCYGAACCDFVAAEVERELEKCNDDCTKCGDKSVCPDRPLERSFEPHADEKDRKGQQLAREKLEKWFEALLVMVTLVGRNTPAAELADQAVEDWLNRRESFGVK